MDLKLFPSRCVGSCHLSFTSSVITGGHRGRKRSMRILVVSETCQNYQNWLFVFWGEIEFLICGRECFRLCTRHINLPPREYWMIIWGPSFLAVVWFGSTPAPSPPVPSVSNLFLFLSLPVRGGRGGYWAESFRPQESLGLYKSFNPLCFRPLKWDVQIRHVRYVSLVLSAGDTGLDGGAGISVKKK